jgi:hypothetical protein
MINKIRLIFPQLILFSLVLLTRKTSASPSCETPVEIDLLTENLSTTEIVTANSFSQTSMTVPSLWWSTEQFDQFGGRLVDNWLADSQEKRIDLIVNTQLWGIMTYLDRYSFVNSFGTVARSYQYNLRVFSQNQQCLALYYYNSHSSPPRWELDLTPSLTNSWKISQ